MSLLPELLRRLARAAHDRNADIVDATLDRLGEHSGWAAAVAEFVARMDDAAYVLARIAAAASESDDGYHGGLPVPRHGDSGTPSGGGMSSVTRDATSSIYAPASLAEWQTALGVAGIASHDPTNLWLGQEASGNLADSIGAVTLTAASAPSYQQTVSGWTRKAVTWADASASKFSNFAGIPNLLTNSFALLGYFFTTNTPAAVREIGGFGNATASQIGATTGQKYRVTNSAGGTTDGTVNYGAGVRPLLFVYNRALSQLKLYLDSEAITGTYNDISGGGVWLGGVVTTTPAGGCVYAAAWSGTAAEFTSAQAKSLLQALGWTVAW